MSKRRKFGAGGRLLLFIFLAAFAGMAVYIARISLGNMKLDLEKALANIKGEYPFAEISVLSKNGSAISAGLKLIGIDGSVAASGTFNLDGRDIFLECKVVLAGSGKISNALVFPFNIYTDRTPPENGKPVTNLYTVNGFPSTYKVTNAGEEYGRAVRFLYDAAFQAGNGTNTGFNGSVIRIMDASLHPGFYHSLEEGRIYRCLVHPNGGLELMEEK
jgi:hypothetical protein